jgi:hypothetical protein
MKNRHLFQESELLVSIEFREAPIRQALHALFMATGKNYTIGNGVVGVMHVKCDNVPLKSLLNLDMAENCLLKMEEQDGIIVVSGVPKKPIPQPFIPSLPSERAKRKTTILDYKPKGRMCGLVKTKDVHFALLEVGDFPDTSIYFVAPHVSPAFPDIKNKVPSNHAQSPWNVVKITERSIILRDGRREAEVLFSSLTPAQRRLIPDTPSNKLNNTQNVFSKNLAYIEVTDAPVRDVYKAVFNSLEVDYVLDTNIQGFVTLSARDIPLEKLLNTVSRLTAKDGSLEVQGEQGNIVLVKGGTPLDIKSIPRAPSAPSRSDLNHKGRICGFFRTKKSHLALVEVGLPPESETFVISLTRPSKEDLVKPKSARYSLNNEIPSTDPSVSWKVVKVTSKGILFQKEHEKMELPYRGFTKEEYQRLLRAMGIK